MAWSRYDLWDPWVVKKTNQRLGSWAVMDMRHNPVYITYSRRSAQQYMDTLQGPYQIELYNGSRPDGIQ